ncbi:DNA primase family protein [Parabacteroides merdae]|uniref:DNA primase n=1 Tax=Parabacteroides merdae TaxID=46503 RepID=A0A7K1HHL6_9BACT|nr:phage/plasmid primase, P4 family [Parabacteroides merdae]MTU30695.1 DNA primase [Parabacteroides merdae]RYS82572.1 DNA primase [Parabacteroides merdae]
MGIPQKTNNLENFKENAINAAFVGKAESIDDVLTKRSVEDYVYHMTRYQREIEKNYTLNEIIKHVFHIDFLNAYYHSEEGVLAYIENLREIIADSKASKDEKSEARTELKRLEPPAECKASIIIDYLLNISEKQKFGIGIMNDQAYYYNGCYWELLEKDFVKNFLSLVAERTGIKHAQASKVKFVDLLYKQFLLSSGLPVQEKTKEVKINLQNGTFVCRNGEFDVLQFSPDDFLTYQLPFCYDKDAKADKFMEFLEYVVPEKEARMVIAEYIAYAFAKHLRWEKCLVLIGSGGNGKSVLIDIITALLGEKNVCHIPLSRLCEANGYYRAEIGNYLLNACSEMGSKNSDPEMVKQLFSNDPVSARSPYGKPITVSNYCRFLFSTNFISNKDMEQTNGFFRRFLFIFFNVTIPEWKKNPNLAKEIINEELSGIFNWVLEGLRRILEPGRQGFTYSAHIDRANKELERNSNSVALFMCEENLQPSDKIHEDAKTLYNKYKNFCEDNHYGAVSKQEFLRRLETQLKYYVKRKATNNATWVYCETAKEPEKDKNKNQYVEKFKAEGIINSNKKEYL